MSPEIFTGKRFRGSLADMWSLGVLLFVILTGKHPYRIPHHQDKSFSMTKNGMLAQEYMRRRAAGQNLPQVSAEALDLCSQLLRAESVRLDMHGVIAHPWVAAGVSYSSDARKAFARASSVPMPVAMPVAAAATTPTATLTHQQHDPVPTAFSRASSAAPTTRQKPGHHLHPHPHHKPASPLNVPLHNLSLERNRTGSGHNISNDSLDDMLMLGPALPETSGEFWMPNEAGPLRSLLLPVRS